MYLFWGSLTSSGPKWHLAPESSLTWCLFSYFWKCSYWPHDPERLLWAPDRESLKYAPGLHGGPTITKITKKVTHSLGVWVILNFHLPEAFLHRWCTEFYPQAQGFANFSHGLSTFQKELCKQLQINYCNICYTHSIHSYFLMYMYCKMCFGNDFEAGKRKLATSI